MRCTALFFYMRLSFILRVEQHRAPERTFPLHVSAGHALLVDRYLARSLISSLSKMARVSLPERPQRETFHLQPPAWPRWHGLRDEDE